jgi:hypothetical protein
MNLHSMRIVPKGDNVRAILSGPLAHLGDVDDDYVIADAVPDFRAHAPRHRGEIPTVDEEAAVLAYFAATSVGSNLG